MIIDDRKEFFEKLEEFYTGNNDNYNKIIKKNWL